jgi:hypothetical protein
MPHSLDSPYTMGRAAIARVPYLLQTRNNFGSIGNKKNEHARVASSDDGAIGMCVCVYLNSKSAEVIIELLSSKISRRTQNHRRRQPAPLKLLLGRAKFYHSLIREQTPWGPQLPSSRRSLHETGTRIFRWQFKCPFRASSVQGFPASFLTSLGSPVRSAATRMGVYPN